MSKRGHSAESSTLLLSALRPRLYFVGIFVAIISSSIIQNAAINNAFAASLTLEIPTTISLDITPASGGTFAKSSASNISVKTDAPWGYNLTIKGKSADTSLVSGSSKLTSITGNLTEDQFKAGASNTWGYSPSKVDSSANTTFHPGPGTTATTIDKTSAKNDTANNYSIILGAKVDDKVIAGAYTNTFTLTSTANTVSYNITYNLNSGSWSGKSPQTGSTVNNTITLDSHTPSKSGYTFQGWCSSSSISNNNTTSTPTCNGTKYSVGASYNLSNGSNTVTMYAMWQQNGTSYSIYYNCNSGSPCPSTQSGTTTNSNITLSSTTPSKSGYTFKGWCSTSPSSNNSPSVSCSGYTYQPSGSYPLSSGANITLYAMWYNDTYYYNILYYCLGGTPCPSTQSGATTSPNITLSSTTPSKSGYTFKAWCEYQPGDNNSAAVYCPGRTYYPNSSHRIDDIPGILWAMWSSNTSKTSCNGVFIPVSPTITQAGKKWTTTKAKCNWEKANKACPPGFHLPSKDEFQSLIDSVGSGAQLYNSGWNDSYYWSSTQDRGNSNLAYELQSYSDKASIQRNQKTQSFAVRCASD